MPAGDIKVLIADDHALLRQGLVRLLEMAGGVQVVGQAVNGHDAVEKAVELQPEVVLMDVNMPGLNGIEATRLIRHNAPTVSVLGLTIHDDEEYICEMIRAGARGYLLKDSEPNLVFQAIERVAAGESYFPSHLMAKVMERFHQLSSEHSRQDTLTYDDGLTRREIEVLQCIVDGMSNKEIAYHLFISEKTVKNHITNLLRKLDLVDRTQAAVYAIQHGLVKTEAGD